MWGEEAKRQLATTIARVWGTLVHESPLYAGGGGGIKASPQNDSYFFHAPCKGQLHAGQQRTVATETRLY